MMIVEVIRSLKSVFRGRVGLTAEGFLIGFIIALIVAALVLVLYKEITGSGSGAIEYLKHLFTFEGRG